MKGQRIAAFGCPHPRRSLTGEGDLLAAEARLVADHGAGAALALHAVAHGDARWFALNRKVKLSAAAGGASSGHGKAPWLSICAECRLRFRTMHHEQRKTRPLSGRLALLLHSNIVDQLPRSGEERSCGGHRLTEFETELRHRCSAASHTETWRRCRERSDRCCGLRRWRASPIMVS